MIILPKPFTVCSLITIPFSVQVQFLPSSLSRQSLEHPCTPNISWHAAHDIALPMFPQFVSKYCIDINIIIGKAFFTLSTY